jgi:hypothetical protein
MFGRKSKARKSSGANFPTTDKGGGVKVSPGKGGAGQIGPSHCEAKRAASNVRQVY